jgi:2-polyprenyl-3-methyl-5-hydroxy-6-metoxy-1,4-benzoquinol methylase
MKDSPHQQEDLWGYTKRFRFVRDAIADAFPGRSGASITILDVGCGTGSQLGIPLARLGYEYAGIDMHERSVIEARRLAKDVPNAEFACGSVDDLEDGPFDVVILSEVLEHVNDPGALLAASLEKLHGSGLMIVTVPNGYGEFEWDSWVFANLGLEKLMAKYEERRNATGASKTVTASTENADDRHVQFFTRPRLHSMFDKAGLEIVKERGSTVMSGPFVGHTLARVPGFIELNAKAADALPIVFSSGWFFSLRRKEQRG